MRLTNELVVPASLDEVWSVLLDVARIAPCLPGASIEAGEGDEYRGTMKVRLGPITSSFQGTIRIEEADESARRAVMSAKARDSRGQGTATATITSTMEPAGDAGTRVTVDTDLRVTGPAASFGRGVMQDVSAKLMGQFADCLAAEIGRSAQSADAAAPGAAEAEGQAAPQRIEGVPLAGPLPPDVPEPPPTEEGVRWPAGGGAPDVGEPAAAERRELPERGDADVLDLGAIGREALVRRLAPVAAAAALLLLIAAVVKRRSGG